MTSSAYSYISLDDNGHSLFDGQNFSLFEIKACHDAHILLMQEKTNFDTNIFEIVIGNKNLVTRNPVIRVSHQVRHKPFSTTTKDG